VLPIYHASITVTARKEKTRDQKNITSILPEKKRKEKVKNIVGECPKSKQPGQHVLNPSNQYNMKKRKSKGENRETTRPKKLIAFLLARPK
jgi:hypothetical protein